MVVIFNWICIIYGNLFFFIVILLVDVWYDYKIECYVDLVLEGDYYWSLLCWGMYGGEVNYGKFVGDIILELSLLVIFVEIS